MMPDRVDRHDGADAGLVCMTPECSLKLIEEPAVYNRSTDELYFVGDEAVPFLTAATTGTAVPPGEDARAFVGYCFEENILRRCNAPTARRSSPQQSPLPSLRYLLLHITDRCNLSCRHCFQGDPGSETHELDLATIGAIVDEFETLQGLRLMVSGGEPMLHPGFWELNDMLAGRDIRSILLTNGTRIDAAAARRLRFSEVQVSIDGVGGSHDRLRGPGTFDAAVAAARALGEAGRQLSIATMIHSGNLGEFDELEELVRELGAREWSIDLPSPSGRLTADSELIAAPADAGPLLNRSFGGAIHEPVPGFACGAHLMAVMADGVIARCGFYSDRPLGTAAGGLRAAWDSMKRMTLDELECDCQYLEICRGGCRFRATEVSGETGVDPCQCYRYGLK